MSQRRAICVLVFLVAGFGVLAIAQESTWTTPPAVQHSTEGRDNCMACHTAGAMEPVPDAPADHTEYPNHICLMCHAPDAAVQTIAPPPPAHDLEGRAACLMCHEPGKMEPVPDTPADHEGRENEYCQLCHQPTG